MDSQAPNHAFEKYLRQGCFIECVIHIKAEVKHGDSRFDLYAETQDSKVFIEVKGVTLEENGIAMFPDAPTVRGIKHLNELAKCFSDGYIAYVVFVIQMDGISHFTPNYKTHPEFGETLVKVMEMGVKAVAYDCVVTSDEMKIGKPIPVK
jgi:sugar fermentation stimulation protein